MFSKPHSRSERGQAIILVAMGLVGLIAMIGLSIDGGMMFIDSSRLKRSVDAAAVAAALQFREGYTAAQLRNAAEEFIALNDRDIYDVQVLTCDDVDQSDPSDPNADLCTTPPRKLVRVIGTKNVDFGFLPVIGIPGTSITTDTVSEAASVDVVLVIDTSASMAYETDSDPALSIGDDPIACNAAHTCQPLENVKGAAEDFIRRLHFPYDRVSIVSFDRYIHTHSNPTAPYDAEQWITVSTLPTNTYAQRLEDAAIAAINGLTVYQPNQCVSVDPPNPPEGSCLEYIGGNFYDIRCMPYEYNGDITTCPSSNIGGALYTAGNTFAQNTALNPLREDSLWAVVLLAGGPANVTLPITGHPLGVCHQDYWGSKPFCRDDDSSTRHASGDAYFDADDYARDAADFVTDPNNGQGAIIFAIGMGDKIRNDDIRNAGGEADIGEKLLTYAATGAGGTSDVGLYRHTVASSQTVLREIFLEIADNIATRLTH